jgi:ATP-binding cassette subfamily C protein LapB
MWLNVMDDLFNLLIKAAKFHKVTLLPEVLRARIGFSTQLTPSEFLLAAEKCGFNAKISKRSIHEIPPLMLPAILILKENHACLLKEITKDRHYVIENPEDEESRVLSLEHMVGVYSGFLIIVQPNNQSPSEHQDDMKKEKPLGWFWKTIWHYKKSYFQVLLAALLVNIFAIISPIYIMLIYDRVVPNAATTTLWVLTSGVFIVYLFDFILRVLRAHIIDNVGKKTDMIISSQIFSHTLGILFEARPKSSGSLVSKIREFDTIREFMTSSVLTSIIDVPFIVLYLLLIAYLAGTLVFVPIVSMFLVTAVNAILSSSVKNELEHSLDAATKKNVFLMESISNLETIKSINCQGLLLKRWEHYVRSAAKHGLKFKLMNSIALNVTNSIQQVSAILLTVTGVYLIFQNQLTLGGLIAANILASRNITVWIQFTNFLSRFQQTKISLNGLNELMMLPHENAKNKNFLHLKQFKGLLEFKNVGFNYPGQTVKILQNINAVIQPGERVAIIGRSGSGKSTLLKIIAAFYSPKEGEYRIDHIDHNQFDPLNLRHHITYVPQESILFSGTLKENIILSNVDASDDDILNVARISGVERFAEQHPQGYGMYIGEKGETLSGGQRQAVNIARALLMNPDILLLDEPSSGMDEQSEKELALKLKEWLKNSQGLIIATHRPGLLELVDRIIVLHEGRIIMDGQKAEIIQLLRGGQSTTKATGSHDEQPRSK